jgi:hypothetical protein
LDGSEEPGLNIQPGKGNQQLEQSLGEVFLSIPSISLEGGADRICQNAYTFDLHLNPVSRFHGADALGRSRDDHISRQEGHKA